MHRTVTHFITSYVCLLAGCLLITELPGIPYNIIELFAKYNVYFSIFLFAGILICSFGIPVFLGFKLVQHKKSHFISYPFWLLVHAAITWVLLSFTVPIESIHDIVGSPILDWPFQFESLYRFIALFSVLSMVLVGISVFSLQLSAFKHLQPFGPQVWIIWFIVLLPLAYLIVVVNAATDNLVELMADQGGFLAFLSLTGWIFFSILPGSYLGGFLAGVFGNWSRLFIFMLLGFVLGFLLLYIGLEHNIQKYGQEFSALQFLLSPNRTSLVSGTTLGMRYLAMEAALIVVVCVSQYPFWKLITANKNSIRFKGTDK